MTTKKTVGKRVEVASPEFKELRSQLYAMIAEQSGSQMTDNWTFKTLQRAITRATVSAKAWNAQEAHADDQQEPSISAKEFAHFQSVLEDSSQAMEDTADMLEEEMSAYLA